MFAVPSQTELATLAESLGITLAPEELDSYQRAVVAQLEIVDSFVQSRLDEGAPEVIAPAREPGYRPSSREDPLNAWLWKCRIQAFEEGILAGKTVSFKDHIAVAGIPLTFNSYKLEGYIPDFDATIVTRALEAGATIVGKNSHDGLTSASGLGGYEIDFQRVVNPHNPAHVTGGSSSGSAAAIAAGEVDISFGGDQGGSIRIPAAWCGVVGLKPTFGLVSHFGAGFGADPSIDFVGPMARTVEDAAAALQAVAGFDGLDPRQGRDVPERLEVLSRLDGGLDGIRIGILEEGFDKPIQPEVHAAVMSAVDVMSEAGAKVSTVSVPEHHRVDQILALFNEGGRGIFQTGFFGAFSRTYYPRSLVVAINELWGHHADLLTSFSKLGLIVGEYSRRNYHGAVYAKAQNVRKSFIRAYDAALSEVDVLILPTCVGVAPKYERALDRKEALEVELGALVRARATEVSDLSVIQQAVRNTMQFNYTGHPALSVPCGKVGGLPVGLQLVGRFFDDPLLLSVAMAFEHSVDWAAITGVQSAA